MSSNIKQVRELRFERLFDIFFFNGYGDHRDLPSFPTRRSSDVLEQQARMMSVDGTAWSAREWGDLVRFLFVEPGGMLGVARHYFDYFRPGFHPNDMDTAGLTEAWKQA